MINKLLEDRLTTAEIEDYEVAHHALLNINKILHSAVGIIKLNTVTYEVQDENVFTGEKKPRKVTTTRLDTAPQFLRALDTALTVLDFKIKSKIDGKTYTLPEYFSITSKNKIEITQEYRKLCMSVDNTISVIRMHFKSIYRMKDFDQQNNNVLLTADSLFESEDLIRRCLNPIKETVTLGWNTVITTFTETIEYIKSNKLSDNMTQEEKTPFNEINGWILSNVEPTKAVLEQPEYTTNMEQEFDIV